LDQIGLTSLFSVKKFLKSPLLLLFVFCSSEINAYKGPNIFFNVFRNEKNIGYHKVTFSQNNEYLNAKVEILFNVKFFGFSLYDYSHVNTEKWENNKLLSVESETNKNGTNLNCNYNENSSDLIPTSYWNHLLVEYKTKNVLNTQDCSIISLNIKKIGSESIYNGSLDTTRYKITGKESTGEDINIDIWYNDDEEWVKLQFLKDGSIINYVLNGFNEQK
tara:strand:+ start:490 stop:1146 length:657 start_codon:yes stop_codon:yes gene_type:complete